MLPLVVLISSSLPVFLSFLLKYLHVTYCTPLISFLRFLSRVPPSLTSSSIIPLTALNHTISSPSFQFERVHPQLFGDGDVRGLRATVHEGHEGPAAAVRHQDPGCGDSAHHHGHQLRGRTPGRSHRVVHVGHVCHFGTAARGIHNGHADTVLQLEGSVSLRLFFNVRGRKLKSFVKC